MKWLVKIWDADNTQWWKSIVAIALCVVAAALFWREPLADYLWPETRAELLREKGATALKLQRLTAPDGTGARQYYEAALAIDPDRSEAHEGLMQVGRAALVEAKHAMLSADFERARRSLRLAQELSVPAAEWKQLALEIRDRESKHAGVDGLLIAAKAAYAHGNLDDGSQAALRLYKRILTLQPTRIEALEGREDAIEDLLQSAVADLAEDRTVAAARKISAAYRYDSGHAGLPMVQERLGNKVENLRQRANEAIQTTNLVLAEQIYRDLLSIDPKDPIAIRGIERLGMAYALRAERASADFEFDSARSALLRAKALTPDADVVREAVQHLQRARQSQAKLRPIVSQEHSRRVTELLSDADIAWKRNHLLTPPGESAFDKLRTASAIAPESLEVRRALDRLVPVAHDCFEDALRNNQLKSAQACLDAMRILEPKRDNTIHASRRLAQRWLAVGDERLAAGEIDLATDALEAAIRLDQSVPGLEEFISRVRAASIGLKQ